MAAEGYNVISGKHKNIVQSFEWAKKCLRAYLYSTLSTLTSSVNIRLSW